MKEERMPSTIQMQKYANAKILTAFYTVLSEYLFQCDAEVFFVVVRGATCYVLCRATRSRCDAV